MASRNFLNQVKLSEMNITGELKLPEELSEFLENTATPNCKRAPRMKLLRKFRR